MECRSDLLAGGQGAAAVADAAQRPLIPLTISTRPNTAHRKKYSVKPRSNPGVFHMTIPITVMATTKYNPQPTEAQSKVASGLSFNFSLIQSTTIHTTRMQRMNSTTRLASHAVKPMARSMFSPLMWPAPQYNSAKLKSF